MKVTIGCNIENHHEDHIILTNEGYEDESYIDIEYYSGDIQYTIEGIDIDSLQAALTAFMAKRELTHENNMRLGDEQSV